MRRYHLFLGLSEPVMRNEMGVVAFLADAVGRGVAAATKIALDELRDGNQGDGRGEGWPGKTTRG